jgi:hypothetical protein
MEDGNARIFIVRGQRVILDSDLAELYGVATKRLNEKVRRNPQRFPRDFVFLLSAVEWDSLRRQAAASREGHCPRRTFLPYVFTEAGALMAAGRLSSKRAVEVSIYLVRGLFAMRQVVGSDFLLPGLSDDFQ